MATYKVIQDIESEDKLLGPLTLRQFIYAAMVIVMGFIAFKLALVNPLLALPFLPPIIFFGMLAAPFGHDQSSEVWMLAKIRFMLKPRKRIWDQSGMQELVTITAPKKIEHALTDGLSQTEVRSRLKALASTIDSRGWAVKNVNLNVSSQPTYFADNVGSSDRLVGPSSLPQEVPTYDVLPADDIMDETSNATAQHLDNMINQSEQAHRQALMATVQAKTAAPTQPTNDYWFMNQPDTSTIPTGFAAFGSSPAITPGATAPKPSHTADIGAAEQQLLEQIHKEKTDSHAVAYGHTKVIDPHGGQAQQPDPVSPQSAQADDNQGQDASAKPVDPAILRLANNDDLNVATIAREANKATEIPPDDEVVISLR